MGRASVSLKKNRVASCWIPDIMTQALCFRRILRCLLLVLEEKIVGVL